MILVLSPQLHWSPIPAEGPSVAAGLLPTPGDAGGRVMNKLERLARDANSLRHVTLADEFQAFPVADWKAELARRAGAFDKAGWFGLSHSYFGDSETVMSDLFLVIHQGLEPSKRPRLVKAKGNRGEYWEFRR